MRRLRKRALHFAVAMGVTMSAFSMSGVEALPVGGKVRSGEAEISKREHTLVIDQHTHNVALDWTTFCIDRGESVVFNQRPTDIALNRVTGNSVSEIYGNLKADGTVFLINPQGILFGEGAQIDTGSLVASTAQVSDRFMTGFGDGVEAISLGLGEASTGKIINAADIKAQGGLVALHAAVVENTGSIENPQGEVVFSAVKNLNLSLDTAGKLNFTASGEVADAHILNSGNIQAGGGRVIMTAKSAGDMLSEVVNHSGVIEAQSIRVDEQGEVILDGGSHGTVNVSGTLDASGLSDGASGGTVKVVGESVNIADGAKLTASGNINGGQVETSGDVLSVSTAAVIDAYGLNGKAGEWFIDPVNIIISNEAPTGFNADTTAAETASGEQVYTSETSTLTTKNSYINADYISWRLSNGTSVRIQALDQHTVDANNAVYALGVSDITVNSAIEKSTAKMDVSGAPYGTAGSDATLTLEAQRNVILNAPITSTDGKLNVVLHADTNGDAKGMVIINADISTNGGDFTAGCGAAINDGRVGTYFGHAADETDINGEYPVDGDRYITTDGGNVALYGDIALGLNKGSLIVDTESLTGRGDITVTGNVDSANSYRLFVNDILNVTLQDSVKNNPDLKKLAGVYYETYLKDTVWKKYADLSEEERATIAARCFQQKTVPTDAATYETVLQKYYNDNVKLGNENVTGTPKAFADLTANEYHQLAKHILTNWSYAKTNNRESILTRWETAELAAREGTNGGSAVGDKYLATITTELENWIVGSLLAGKENEVLVGGKTAVVGKNVKAGREFYWVTGPEGEANNGQGTLFFTTTGNAQGIVADDMYQGWSHDLSHGVAFNEPNNDSVYDQPYVGVSWKSDASWADVDNQNRNIIGFVQETNNERSSIEMYGKVINIGGNVGKSAILKNVWLDASDSVNIGGGINHSSGTNAAFTGHVNTDGYAYLKGTNEVNVGGTITSKIDDVVIAEGDLTPPIVIDTSAIVVPGGTTEPVITSESNPSVESEAGQADETRRPQLTHVNGQAQRGSGSYDLKDAKESKANGVNTVVDQVLGLTTARLPVVRVHNGVRVESGMYSLQVEPDHVSMEAVEQKAAKLPDVKSSGVQREYTTAMTLSGTEAQFRITYDGAALSIYPTDAVAQALLENSESRHNVDVVSNALHIAFSQMGLQLDDLDVVYVYY